MQYGYSAGPAPGQWAHVQPQMMPPAGTFLFASPPWGVPPYQPQQQPPPQSQPQQQPPQQPGRGRRKQQQQQRGPPGQQPPHAAPPQGLPQGAQPPLPPQPAPQPGLPPQQQLRGSPPPPPLPQQQQQQQLTPQASPQRGRRGGSQQGGRAATLNLPPGGVRVGGPPAAAPPAAAAAPQGAGSGGHQSPPPAARDPPWLLHAGLPNDGSVEARDEVSAFASFVHATPSEQARRRALRTVVQKIAHLHVSPEATAKVIGSVATGLDTFASGLDIVVEVPAGTEEAALAALQKGLSDLGVDSRVASKGAGQCIVVAAGGLSVISPGWHGADFSAYVYCRVGHSAERLTANQMRALLDQYPNHRQVVLVARAVLGQMNLVDDSGGLPSHALSLMALALFEMLRERQSFNDTGWVLREFFRHYASFDFSTHSIACGIASREEGVGWPYIPKQHPSDQLSVIDPGTHCNAAASTRKLPQIAAMLHYVTTCIQRFDRVGSRSLLSNIVAHNDLWDRLQMLQEQRQSEGGAVTKEFALSLIDSLCGFFSDPRQSSTRERFARAVRADAGLGETAKREMQSISDELGLVDRRLQINPQSRLRAFRDDPRRLAEMVLAMDDADVRSGLSRLTSVAAGQAESEPHSGWDPLGSEAAAGDPHGSDGSGGAAEDAEPQIDAEVVYNMMNGLADYLEDPANSSDLEELLMKGAEDQSQGKQATKLQVLERIVEFRLAQKPNSRLAPFRHNIPLLADKVWEHWRNPLVQGAVLRIVTLNGLFARHVQVSKQPGSPGSPSAAAAAAAGAAGPFAFT